MKKFKTLLKDLLESGAPCLHGALFAVPFVVLLLPLFAQADGVHALFNLDTKTEAPFPTNWFTVPDRSNNTNLRVNLPYPDCKVYLSDCEDIEVINTLDGFNMQPRLSIPFDGPIDVHSVTSQTVFLISLGDSLDRHDRGGQSVGINQIVWDVETNTLHVESDELLDQHTRYALIVTIGVRDATGRPVQASESFRRFRSHVRGEYKQELLEAIHAARQIDVREDDIVTTSVFTTQSATAVLERMRDQIHAATPAPADFLLGLGRSRTVFPLNDVTGIVWRQQTRDNPPAFTDVTVNLPLLRIIPGAVGQVAFGKYVSPDYEVHPGEFIPPVGTRTGTPVVQGVNEIYFTLALPSGPRPRDGWPVAIWGHGGGGSSISAGGIPNVAASMANHGLATIGINAVGHGRGALGTLTVGQTAGGPVTFSSGGRGIDQNGDGFIDVREGIRATRPRMIIDDRDGFRQTAADLMQLVRVIQVGMDVDGDGSRDLDPSRIYYFGGSLGGAYGTVFLAVEPDVRAGVLAVPPGPRTLRTLSVEPVVGDRNVYGSWLASRTPSLINGPGITHIDGVPVPPPPYFNENMPLRNGIPLAVRLEDGTSYVIQSPVINTVQGANAIQEFLDNAGWVLQAGGEPFAYAPHLRKAPLAGVPTKSVIIQFAKGDLTLPNPSTTALIRAGNLANRTLYYRHDLAYAERPTLPKNPHAFMAGLGAAGGFLEIGLPVQAQIATFFASDGRTVIEPPGIERFFEWPIRSPLPEDLNYIP
jgi:Bacterial virulence factor lipase N-terminal